MLLITTHFNCMCCRAMRCTCDAVRCKTRANIQLLCSLASLAFLWHHPVQLFRFDGFFSSFRTPRVPASNRQGHNVSLYRGSSSHPFCSILHLDDGRKTSGHIAVSLHIASLHTSRQDTRYTDVHGQHEYGSRNSRFHRTADHRKRFCFSRCLLMDALHISGF